MLLSLIIVVTFTACKPEPEPEQPNGGTDNPPAQENVKISKIYVENGKGKELSEIWIWDKEQLKKIEFYMPSYEGEIELKAEEYYTYNDNSQITRIEDFGHGEYIEYIYDGDKITKARAYDEGELFEDWRFSYENNKISKIELVFGDYKTSDNKLNPLKIALPNELSNHIRNYMRNTILNHRSDVYIELTWDGDNISNIEEVVDGYRLIIDLKYDNKLNPFYNFLGLNAESYVDELYGSKNNVTQIVYTHYSDGETYNEVTNYSYNYDGDYPTVIRQNGSSSMVWYYEYE